MSVFHEVGTQAYNILHNYEITANNYHCENLVLVYLYTGMFPVGDTSSGTLIAVCVCVCQSVSQSVSVSVRRHIAILRQE